MMKAIIQFKGHQYWVEEGEELIVDRCPVKEGETINLDSLLCVDDKKVTIGTPLLDNINVIAEVVKHAKGEKIRVARFQAKSHRRVKGFRPLLTKIRIIEIKEKKN